MSHNLRSRMGRVGAIAAFALLATGTITTIPAPAVAAEPCPNEQLRGEDNSTSLPDCRAYEMVSPVSKQASILVPQVVSEDGDSFDFESSGALPGALERLPLGGHYLAQRSQSGWETVFQGGIAGSGFQPNSAGQVDVTGTLASQVWEGRLSESSPGEYAIRQPNGTFLSTGVGPVAFYGGASSDLEDIVFNAAPDKKLLPVDPGIHIGPGGLYEIAGADSGSPSLHYVALDNAGDALPATETPVTLGSSTAQANNGSKYNAISANGASIFFDVAPVATYNGDTQTQVFARINNTETVDLSEPTIGATGDCSTCTETAPYKPAEFLGASKNGEKVFFKTEQGLFSGQTTENIYEYDFNAPAHHRIILVSSGSAAPEVQGVVRISNDGSLVYFVAKGKLAPFNAEYKEPVEHAANLYAFEQDEAHPAGQITFIADLCSGSGKSGSITDAQCPPASTATDTALWRAADEHEAQATPEGRFLVFGSVAGLTEGDTSTVTQIFRYDAQTGELVRVSAGEGGYGDNGNTTTQAADVGAPAGGTFGANADLENSVVSHRAVSQDGQDVVFTTADALSPRDTNNEEDVYEWHNGSVSLISDGKDPEGSSFSIMSASGSDIFFTTRDSLVGQDSDTGEDIYDARVNGGFPAPTAPSPACSGDTCQGSLGALFSAPGPNGSASQVAGENVAPGTTTVPAAKESKPKPLTKAQKLAKALKQCKKDKHKKKRTSCEKKAGKKYGTKAKKNNQRK